MSTDAPLPDHPQPTTPPQAGELPFALPFAPPADWPAELAAASQAHWALADAEVREAAWVGADLHLRLSALPLSWRGEGGRTEHGHLSGLALVCVGAQRLHGALLHEALGRLGDGQLRLRGTWHRRWPLAQAVPGPLHLALSLPHRSELTLDALGAHLVAWGPLRLHPSMAC